MSEKDDLKDIPPLVPERDDVASHRSNKRAQSQEIVRPSYYTRKVEVSTWPVRIMLILLTLGVVVGGYGAYYFYGEYQNTLRQSELRIGDLEVRLALAGETAEESDNDLMDNINRTIEQYDLLWANWRANNREFEEFQSEIARLKMSNDGQDETTATNSQAIASTNQSLMANETQINSLTNEMEVLVRSVTGLNANVDELSSMRSDLESIRLSLTSGDSTVLGLVGRLEYIEESMESVNAHRLQINESLYRLQESFEALQRVQSVPGSF
jgi:chromosome segregation ATPase|tara:strand:+ start:400 stop:1206 length:807 start_codon:yes stop_codon:yes gene_type:complete